MYQQIQIIMSFRGTFIEEYHEIKLQSEIRDICNDMLVRNDIKTYVYAEAHFDCYQEEIQNYKKVKVKIASIDCPVPINEMTEKRFKLEVANALCTVPRMFESFVRKYSLDNSKSFICQLESLNEFVNDFKLCLSELRRTY